MSNDYGQEVDDGCDGIDLDQRNIHLSQREKPRYQRPAKGEETIIPSEFGDHDCNLGSKDEGIDNISVGEDEDDPIFRNRNSRGPKRRRGGEGSEAVFGNE